MYHKSLKNKEKIFSIAPMMDWTDRHERVFLRGLTRHALLYTEMVTTGAILHGERTRLIGFSPIEHPLALQLGGSEPADLARCTAIAEAWGYDEVNLNLGCPSDRVQRGRFGACLMREPALVARCVTAMRAATSLPVTAKLRLGIDQHDSFAYLRDFVDRLADAGCQRFILHARKAWLKGLSPKQNRELPPLDHGRVYRLKQERPELAIVNNGGILDLDQAADHLRQVDGVMLGRVAYQNPYLLAEVDRRFFGDPRLPPSRTEVVEAFLPYVAECCAAGIPLKAMTRHILGLFNGQPGARQWRRYLSENAVKSGASPHVIRQALDIVAEAAAAHEAARAA